jgi:hypothetical protein
VAGALRERSPLGAHSNQCAEPGAADKPIDERRRLVTVGKAACFADVVVRFEAAKQAAWPTWLPDSRIGDGAILAGGKGGDKKMLYRIGRFLQLAGLVLLPIGIAGNMADKLDLRESLSVSAVGIVAFIVGWSLQQFSRPP